MSQARPFQLRRVRSGQETEAAASIDMHLLLPTIMLVTFGIIMVFSASYPTVLATRTADAYYFVKRQALFALLGGLGLWICSRLRRNLLYSLVYYFFGISIFLLMVVLVVGKNINGARSWIPLGLFNLQPSEMAKVALMLALARYFGDHPNSARSFNGLLPALLMGGTVFGLIMLEKDMGTTAIASLAFLAMLFLAGANLKHLGAMVAAAGSLGVVFIAMEPYRIKRILAFLDPERLADSGGYHITRSLIALGSGGPFGLGFARSREKFFYLPTPHTDSIFAVVGEELGLVFCLGVLALFLWLGWRGLKIAAIAPRGFPALAAAGMTNLLLLQASVNIFVIMGLMPATGLPLPFLSYGGSSLLFSMAAVGILANISRYATSTGGVISELSERKLSEKNAEAAVLSSRHERAKRALKPRGF